MFVRCLIGQVATMNREKGGRHNQCLDKWLKEFGRLQTRGSGDDLSMICKDCPKAGKKNVFTSGCKNFQRSALVRHMSQVDHKSSAKSCPPVLTPRQEEMFISIISLWLT